MNTKICCGLVLYNPEIKRLKENILSVAKQVHRIIIVDNYSTNWTEIQELIDSLNNDLDDEEDAAGVVGAGQDAIGLGDSIRIIRNNENYGIAHALNQLNVIARKLGYSWILTLDQDSVISDTLIDDYASYIETHEEKKIGQLCCNIIDRNVGKLKDDAYGDKAGHSAENDSGDAVEVEFCITSGALTNVEATIECGGYDEKLFIDAVDEDISLRLAQYGYETVRINTDGLIHELGNGSNNKALGIDVTVSNHVPWRNYYARRNHIYIARKYYKGSKRTKAVLKQIAYALGIVILEDQKSERLKQNFKGIADGLKMRIS